MIAFLHVACWVLALASFAWSLYLLRRYKQEKRKAEINFRTNCDDAETDLAVRSIVLPVLGNTLTHGDRYGVPTLEDIARKLVARTTRAEAAAQWRKIHVEPAGRGPNADLWYWVPPTHQGHSVHFTDEALVAAKVSANRNLQHPHTFTA
jgi:hypothetical protein